VRDLARATLIAFCFFLLAAPARYGATARAFATATALLVVASAALLGLSMRAPHARAAGGTPVPAAALAYAAAASILLVIASRAWLQEILVYPHDPLRADMLIVIQQGIRRVLQGRNPYTIYHVPWDATLPYGPVMWIPYIVPYALRVDVRFVSLLGVLFVPAACAVAAASLAWSRRYLPAAACLIVLGAIAYSPDLRGFASIAHTPSYWPLLGLLAWFVTRERWSAAAVTCGLLFVARTTMAATAPVLLMAVWYRDRRQFPWAALLLAAAAGIPYLPFAIADWRALIYALYGSYQSLMKGFVWTQTTWVQQTVGVTGLLLRTGLQRYAGALQAVVMLAIYAAAWRSIRGGGRPLPWMTIALLAFSMTTFWPVHYIYFDVFLLWACGMLAEGGWPATSGVLLPWGLSLASAAIVLAAVSWLEIPGDPALDIGTGAVRPYLYRGFSTNEGDERTFAWVDGNEAELLVPRRSRGDAELVIVCQPHLPTRGSTQAMSVALNGVLLGTVGLHEGWQPATFDAPARAWIIGVNELTLSFSSATSPAETGTGDDGRKLSAAVDRLIVRTK
jgi:hypothetical protein